MAEGKDKEEAEVIRFPLPKAEPPKNPEPKHTCGNVSGKPCPACS